LVAGCKLPRGEAFGRHCGGPSKSRARHAPRPASSFKVSARELRQRLPMPWMWVPGSILKIEDDNRDPTTGKQRQVHCLAISAKRYALFLRDERGNPVLLRTGVNNKDDRWSEHGLGHLLNPTDPQSDDREWIAHAWLTIIRKRRTRHLGRQASEALRAIRSRHYRSRPAAEDRVPREGTGPRDEHSTSFKLPLRLQVDEVPRKSEISCSAWPIVTLIS
jgi:hypothetical protein